MQVIILLVVTVFSLIATYERNIAWKSELDIWEDAWRKNSKKDRVYVYLGIAYYHQGLIDKSINSYEMALRINPDDPYAHTGIGLDYASHGFYDEAYKHYQTALRLKPDNATTHYHLGLMFLEPAIRDVTMARKEFELALQIDPNNSCFASVGNGLCSRLS